MTLIEFYDKSRIENIAGALITRADNLILIGDNLKIISNCIPTYQKILEKRGIFTKISCMTINKNNLTTTIKQLTKIVEDNENCIFDLTGGEDLYLVAVGVLMEKYPEKIQCHRFNLKNSTITDCDADGNIAKIDSFDISTEENIMIYGGRIVDEADNVRFVFDDDFNRDVDVIWNIAKENQQSWNASTGSLGDILKLCNKASGLMVRFNENEAKTSLASIGENYRLPIFFLKRLERNLLIKDLKTDGDISFEFKNASVKNALSTPGKMLEIAIASKLSMLKDENGADLYNDVRVGTVIDWTADENDTIPTINEIDVLAMKDAIPVFISCKSGFFDANELYKLKTVSLRFGGSYAKCAIAATSMERLGQNADNIRSRAEDMKIRLIENVDEMNDEKLSKVLRSLYCN